MSRADEAIDAMGTNDGIEISEASNGDEASEANDDGGDGKYGRAGAPGEPRRSRTCSVRVCERGRKGGAGKNVRGAK